MCNRSQVEKDILKPNPVPSNILTSFGWIFERGFRREQQTFSNSTEQTIPKNSTEVIKCYEAIVSNIAKN